MIEETGCAELDNLLLRGLWHTGFVIVPFESLYAFGRGKAWRTGFGRWVCVGYAMCVDIECPPLGVTLSALHYSNPFYSTLIYITLGVHRGASHCRTVSCLVLT